jgi:hypothetical protein
MELMFVGSDLPQPLHQLGFRFGRDPGVMPSLPVEERLPWHLHQVHVVLTTAAAEIPKEFPSGLPASWRT